MPALTPFRHMWPAVDELERAVDDAFQRWFTPAQRPAHAFQAFQPGRPPWQAPESLWAPRVDVTQRDGELVVHAEIPGVDPERDIEVFAEDEHLTIRGQRRQEVQTQDERFVRVETNFGMFQRTIPLPGQVDSEGIRASYRDGILEVVVPASEQSRRARRISVESQAPLGTRGTTGRRGSSGRGTTANGS
jgi:HSP20 family protein